MHFAEREKSDQLYDDWYRIRPKKTGIPKKTTQTPAAVRQ
jgi:hypothetical protein